MASSPAPPPAAVPADAALAGLAAALRGVQAGEVRFDAGGAHLYAGDASQHRVVPHGVVLPRSADDVAAVAATCTEHGVAMTPRGAGTSLAGNAVNRAVVVDTSRWLRSQSIDPEARTATVGAGVVLDDLRREANRHRLTFGPDPSTSNRCTFGGMLGNNACGTHSLTTGRTSDNVLSLRGVLADGSSFDTAAGPDALPFAGALRSLGADVAGEVARRHPAIPRRVSGYNLGDLAPDHFDLARFLVGSEGTLAFVTEATVRLVDWSPHRALALLAFASAAEAADAVPSLLAAAEGMIGLEGIDEAVVLGARHRGAAGTVLLPEPPRTSNGAVPTWLLVEFDGSTVEESSARARRCVEGATADGIPAALVDTVTAQAALWQVRTAGLGAVTFVAGAPAKVGGWEDAAVAPARLGSYLRGFHDLADTMGVDVALYGHFGEGCVHTKVGVDHATPDGIARFRQFVEAAADLTVAHNGSLSGEHGDGRSRSELLGRMLGPELLAAQRQVKGLFDPAGLLNPGIVVDPAPLDADLRMAGTRAGALIARAPIIGMVPERTPLPAWFRWLDDQGDMAVAANRCIGMGVCRRDDDHGTMCPTYRVTGEEQHSTRGRARLLQEAMRADTRGAFSLDDPAVAESLDLCLSCKGCLTDCPTDVDVATLKAEFNAWRWRGRRRGGERRPLLQTAFGLTPWLLRAGSRAPRLANALAGSRVGRAAAVRAGVTADRPLPQLATTTFRVWWAARGGSQLDDGPEVVLFVDTFSDTLAPGGLIDTVRVLESAGRQVIVLDEPVCCARPMFDPGMLRLARRTLRQTVKALAPFAHAGIPIVGVEASCTSALVDEAPNLLDSPDAHAVAAGVTTLAGVLADAIADGWTPPRLERDAVVHGHCHQHATVRMDAEAQLLDAMGLRWRDLDAGCCGLAGAYGFEAGDKYAMSVAIGESRLLPAVRSLEDDTLLIADGWSCRTQLDHLGAGRRPWHLATLLATALSDAEVTTNDEGLLRASDRQVFPSS